MVLLRENFIQLQYVGLWQPPCWPPNSFKSRAYLIYTIHLLTILNCFMISEALGLFTIIENLEDFSDSCFMMLTIFSVCVKSMVVLLKRSDIIDILSSLEMNPYKPMNIHEEKIQEFFNRRIRFFTFLYGGVVEISVWIMSISAFFQGIPFGVLPYKVWLPFDYSQPILYWSTFCAQLFVITLGANICIGCDTVIPGFYTLVCAQFSILKYRLENVIDGFAEEIGKANRETGAITRERCERGIIHCVQYHRAIFEISQKINSISSNIIFVQYMASCIIICLSIFMLSQMPLFSFQCMYFILFLICMLSQIFLLCVSANEATIECESVVMGIYNTKWYHLSHGAKRYLGLMMVRTLRPVFFKSGHIIVLSLSSFSNLVKHSYSAYNVLQQNSN